MSKIVVSLIMSSGVSQDKIQCQTLLGGYCDGARGRRADAGTRGRGLASGRMGDRADAGTRGHGDAVLRVGAWAIELTRGRGDAGIEESKLLITDD